MSKYSISTISLLFFYFVLQTHAQYFSGKVQDEKGNPLEGANVYFDATNLGVITGKGGNFKIEIPEIKNTLLVIRFLGYETLYISNLENNNQTYILQPKNNELEEVFLSKSIFSREALLNVFKREFLGNTKNGRNCKIINEDAIRIKFDANSNTINAFSNEDLIVINSKLNYKIRFNLVDFEAQLTYQNLANKYVQQSFFYGTSFFENVAKHKNKHHKRREKAYSGSIQHFFRALYTSRLEQNNFTVAKNGFRVSPKDVFQIDKSNHIYKLHLGKSDAQKNSALFERMGKETPYIFKVILLYKNKYQTDIKFTTKAIHFDEFGNYSPVEHVLLIGEMAKHKLGEMLPSNYKYEQHTSKNIN